MVGIVISCGIKNYVHCLKPFGPAHIQAFGTFWALGYGRRGKRFLNIYPEQPGDHVQGVQLYVLAAFFDVGYRGS
jgi:hypothetical protein